MNLFKRGDTWWVEYQVNGIRHRESCHTKNRKIAERWVNSINTAKKMPDLESAIQVLKMIFGAKECNPILLSEAWETYLELAKSVGKDRVKPETIRQRKIHLNAFVRWISENAATIETVSAVNGAIAARYAAYLVSCGTKSKTRINTIADLSCVWNMLSKASQGLQNVWQGLRPTNTDGERIPAFSPSQERSVLEAAKKVGKDWYPVCVLARNTGLRYEDCAFLEKSEVDFASKIIRLNPEKTKRYGIEVVIPMVDELYSVLKAIKIRGNYFFPIHEQFYGDNSQKRQRLLSFREVLEEAGLYGKGFTFHSWRHVAASRLSEAGASKEIRKAILGHTSDTMAERYDHFDHLDEKRRALEAAASIK